jgi:hypothetical protein
MNSALPLGCRLPSRLSDLKGDDETNRDSFLKGGLDSKAVIEQRRSANLVRRRKQSNRG